ncbi:MAG: hypothetical protein HOC70_14855 [Gammaproteobacteria bacterium]|jgi:hypothetical protein|nr:hypothetical protein [Gammaproteobacteria bacterium]MBT4494520.1 hypothetical protein [Gammaproteobacteria bacterium]MBT7371730.1 hypothetical protein [Gammaproteobacteria bacterium]
MTEHNDQDGKTQAFEEKAKRLLDESVEYMDGPTAAKLHQARSRALESRSRSFRWQTWSGAGALAASVALVAVFVVREPAGLPVIYEDPMQQAVAEEMELMDDLDFMAWLVLEEGETYATDRS